MWSFVLLGLVVGCDEEEPLAPIPPDTDADADKDGDGFTDAEEATWKSDPADPYSWPYESGLWPDFTDEASSDGISGVGYAIGEISKMLSSPISTETTPRSTTSTDT